MGLLDSALGMLGGNSDQGNDPKAMLLQAALGMLTNNQSANGQNGQSDQTGSSGLSGLVSAFENAGLGNIVSSWISNGHNLPISADQIKSALGNGQLAQLAEAAGLSHDGAAVHLAEMLPGLVDKLTPNGEVATSDFGELGNMLEQFSSSFLSKA
ncbi:YidB family protein [Undibacterium sp. RTI2.1]|uniref:YidB family protein n=1 Tax=unclassified Undibacterium TaxID=2630295 RepID=UPI002B228E49|nr:MULTISPECIES: YidB family protein [unclassified Undibacterium]MEB0030541.1 YidB family protein [Undibacterium sp. RTI2.1]MEB0116958.1 YidB family protein [Undibacterium sp. RTI2.2]